LPSIQMNCSAWMLGNSESISFP